MQQDADQPTSNRRVTVKEAATILGISPEAVRARIKRGTLEKDKDEDGTVYVRLDADQSLGDDDGAYDGTDAQPLIVARLENEVEFLRRELERKDALLLNMTEVMKALNPPASREAPDAPETGSDLKPGVDPLGDDAGTEAGVSRRSGRSWWRRIFSG